MKKALVNTKVIAITSNHPRTGKSTCGELLREYLTSHGCSVEVMAFNEKLFEMTATLVGESLEYFMNGYDSTVMEMLPNKDYSLPCNNVYKWWKDYPLYYFQGELRSKREMLIWTSENFVKPHVSDDYFGEVLAKRISWQNFVIVTGLGFVSEAESLINRVGVKNLTIIQLHKDVENSVKCSRKMLTAEDFHETMCPQFVEVDNNGTIEELESKLIEIVNNIK